MEWTQNHHLLGKMHLILWAMWGHAEMSTHRLLVLYGSLVCVMQDALLDVKAQDSCLKGGIHEETLLPRKKRKRE